MGGAFGSKGNVKDQTNGVTPVVILSGTGSNLPYIGASTDPTAYNGQNQNYVAYHQPVGGSYQWNVQAQRKIGSNMVASFAYVASHGHDLPFPVDINEVPESQLSPNDRQQFRPYPQFGTLATTGTVAGENVVSNYNSLQASIEKRLTQGLSFSFNYVWSHFLSDTWTRPGGEAIPELSIGRMHTNRRPTTGTQTSMSGMHSKAMCFISFLFGQGRQFLNNNRLLDATIGGWQLASTIVVQSGQPFTAIMSDGTNSYSLAGSNFAWYPNAIGNSRNLPATIPIIGSTRRPSQFQPLAPSATKDVIR